MKRLRMRASVEEIEKNIFLPENLFLIDDWMEVDEQELVYPITRDSSKGREEKKEEKACSSSLVVHKMASSRRENHAATVEPDGRR